MMYIAVTAHPLQCMQLATLLVRLTSLHRTHVHEQVRILACIAGNEHAVAGCSHERGRVEV